MQIDRDFKTMSYGMGTGYYIYFTNENENRNENNKINLTYSSIKFQEYNESENKLTVILDHANTNSQEEEVLTLTGEPDTKLFENTLYKDWENWDKKFGKYDEDRSDYEPWCLNSIDSIRLTFDKT